MNESGEFADERLNLWIVGGDGAALAEVAGSAGEGKVAFLAGSALRSGDLVVNVEDAPILFEELENAPTRDFCADRPLAAVGADPSVSFADGIAYCSRDVSRVAHGASIATGIAVRVAGWGAAR